MAHLHTAYLALGSNLGDRAANLHAAIRRIKQVAQVERTSFLYESPPAYVVDQPPFLNAVCRIRTSLEPTELLAVLKAAEADLGRRKTIRYGPRIVDMDILFYDDLQMGREGDDLIIPHPRLQERDFVLQPLCDLDPDLKHPVLAETVGQLWKRLGASPLPKVMPVRDTLWRWDEKTRIMGILNITPDSFSGDGLLNGSRDVVDLAVARAGQLVADGADCIDVGGLSTRPGHQLIPEEEERERVLPVVRALADAIDVPISVDTFRSGVAVAALDAGAHMINDVWGLRFDPQIGQVAADRLVPLVVMHNRALPEDPAYASQVAGGAESRSGDVVADVRAELAERLTFAESQGVPRWLIIGDPGIGFGKSPAEHLELVRRLDEIKSLGYPLLFGPSRKGFIGRLLGGLPPEERVEGTVALCVFAVQNGADILRVHDVRAVARAARLADAVIGKGMR
jgi:dihydropteroate synthase/2-amino-4-hydroxy-6-hydroxymethyldihydropteridine diphosphokinase